MGLTTVQRYCAACDLGNGLNNVVNFQYSLNISKKYMYITTSAE